MLNLDKDLWVKETLSDDLIQVLDNVNVAIFIDDGKGYEQWFNIAAEELYQIDRNDIIGKNMTQLEEEGVFVPSLTKKILEKGSAISIIHENRVGRKLVTSGVPLKDEDNNIYRVVTSSVDITQLVNLENELQEIQDKLLKLTGFEEIIIGDNIFNSQSMKNIISLAKKLVDIDSTILITGESGTGKGIIAKFIHNNGNRRDKPFIKINCGAVPENLLESEFFGYESGAFTGSRKGGKKGLFEVAQNGTIFLDEIAELPINLQVKILQVLQEKEIQKVGGIESIPINARIIAATNKDLKENIRKGTFREDLYYRLNVVPIHIPPLRERPEDIITMIRTFLKKENEKFQVNKTLDSNALAVLLKYSWPGNVRELENIIERLVITTKGSTIVTENLPSYLYENIQQPSEVVLKKGLSLKKALEITEKHILASALKEFHTTRKIAQALEIDQSTIVRKLNKYKLQL